MNQKNNIEKNLNVKLKLNKKEISQLEKIAKKKHCSVEKLITNEIKKFIKFYEININFSYL